MTVPRSLQMSGKSVMLNCEEDCGLGKTAVPMRTLEIIRETGWNSFGVITLMRLNVLSSFRV